MITRDGVDWLTAAEVADQLGGDVTPELLRDWKRRGLIRGTIIGRVGHYRLDDVEAAEMRTRGRTKTRLRGMTAALVIVDEWLLGAPLDEDRHQGS